MFWLVLQVVLSKQKYEYVFMYQNVAIHQFMAPKALLNTTNAYHFFKDLFHNI